MDLPAVLAVTGPQHGVISRRQLDDLGVLSSALSRACRRGLLERVLPDVFRLRAAPPDFWAYCTAVELQMHGGAFLGCATAARIHGFRRMSRLPIHVTVPEGRRLTAASWMRVHWSSWFDVERDTTTVRHLTVATPLRTLFGLAAELNQFRFERAAEDAWHLGLVTPEDAANYLERHRCRGKDGVATLERWLERVVGRPRPAQSGLELDVLEAFARVGLPTPARQHPVTLPSGESIHLDIAWPTVRLAVEPGAAWWHGGDLAQRRDQARDRACGEIGWMVVRFDETVRDDLIGAARQVHTIYLRRRADLSAGPGTSPDIA